MAEDCFKWARETVDDDVRGSYLKLGQNAQYICVDLDSDW